MAIGLGGLTNNNQIGIGAPALTNAPLNHAAPQETAPAPQTPGVWFGNDTVNQYAVPWDEFNVTGDAAGFKQLLNTAYQEPKPVQKTLADYAGGNYGRSAFPSVQQMVEDQKRRNAPASAPLPSISFKDANLDAALGQLRTKAEGYLNPAESPVNQALRKNMQYVGQFSGMAAPTLARMDRQRDKQLAALKVEGDSYGYSPLSLIRDNAAREAILREVSGSTGIGYDDLSGAYGKYDKAYRSIMDPVGANWQDLKSSPIYDPLLQGIRDYANTTSSKGKSPYKQAFSDDYFNRLNEMAGNPDANPNGLPAEYFALHQPMEKLRGRGGAGQAGHGYSAIKNSNPFQHEDWTDYADQNKAWWQLTPTEKALAEAGITSAKTMRDKPYQEGGPFSFFDGVKLPKAKGGKWEWQYSRKLGEANAAQNMLGYYTKGEKNLTDMGYDPDLLFRTSTHFDKDKGSFLGGLGSLIGPLSMLASVVPGLQPLAIPLKIASAVSSFANGNPLGGLASLGGFLPGGGPVGAIGNAIGGGNEMLSNAISGGINGALGGFSSGNALAGALTGGLSPVVGNQLTNAGFSGPVAKALTSGIGTGANMLYQNQKRKAAQQAALAKYKGVR